MSMHVLTYWTPLSFMFCTSAVRSAANGNVSSKNTTCSFPSPYCLYASRVPVAHSFDSADTP